MQTFRDLVLRGSSMKLRAALDSMTVAAVSRWARDADAEARTESSADLAAFHLHDDRFPAARLWIHVSQRSLEVVNVVPVDPGSLDHGQYNAIVRDFHDSVAEPAATHLGLAWEMSGGEVDISELLNPEALGLLRSFSQFANRAGLHSLDLHRWYAFAISAHRDQSRLTPDVLQRWLIEEEEWSPDRASELAVRYEEQRELLDLYDREARSA